MAHANEDSSQQSAARSDEGGPDGVLLSWDGAVRMVGDRFFMWDMAKLWAISCAFLAVVMLAIGLMAGSPHMLRFAVIVPVCAFVGFYLLSLLIALVFYFNRYYQQSTLTDKGVSSELVRWSGKLSKAVAAGNIVLGLVKASPTNVGAGVLANVQRSVFISWADVRKVTEFPGQRVITISNSWRPVLRLHCPNDEIYQQAREIIDRHYTG